MYYSTIFKIVQIAKHHQRDISVDIAKRLADSLLLHEYANKSCSSQVTIYVIVPRRMLLAIPAGRSLLLVMCAEHVPAIYIISKIARLQNKPGENLMSKEEGEVLLLGK